MKLLQDAEWSHWSDREIAKRAAGMNLFGACDPLKSCDLDHVLHPESYDSVVMSSISAWAGDCRCDGSLERILYLTIAVAALLVTLEKRVDGQMRSTCSQMP
jgi:hypothetical protein